MIIIVLFPFWALLFVYLSISFGDLICSTSSRGCRLQLKLDSYKYDLKDYHNSNVQSKFYLALWVSSMRQVIRKVNCNGPVSAPVVGMTETKAQYKGQTADTTDPVSSLSPHLAHAQQSPAQYPPFSSSRIVP